MEEGLFTLWSIAHLLVGIIFAFVFSNKFLKIIEYAGVIALYPLFFIDNAAVKIISLTVIILALFAFVIEYLAARRRKLKKLQAAILVMVLIFAWEIFEYFTFSITGFGAESLANRAADIVIGFAGFILTFIFLHKIKKSQ
jgi:uncharacterized membrane protein YuzA (DUF378 family)